MSNLDLTPELAKLPERVSKSSIFLSKAFLTRVQVILLMGLINMIFLIMINNELEHSFNTLLLLVFITIFGIWSCNRTANLLDDRKLKILGSFWLIKVIATLFLLFVGWMPQLDPSSPLWGYDPQRYYQYGWDLVQRGWDPIGLEQNYQGVIFYYGAIFSIFGHNPVIPAFINAFITLLGTLFLIRCA